MEIKFKKTLDSYKFIVMFDLASKNTGVCVWNLRTSSPYFTTVIKVKGECELPAAELEQKIDGFFENLREVHGIAMSDILVVKEAMPSQLRGGSSTVQTFVALARTHCVLDTYLYKNNIDTYDYIGIYPITWHNYFKRIINADKEFKVDKKVVYDYNIKEYNIRNPLTLDESDAIFLSKTFVDIKWNNDIDEEVREKKRHRKTLKAPHAIKAIDEEIEKLKQLKV